MEPKMEQSQESNLSNEKSITIQDQIKEIESVNDFDKAKAYIELAKLQSDSDVYLDEILQKAIASVPLGTRESKKYIEIAKIQVEKNRDPKEVIAKVLEITAKEPHALKACHYAEVAELKASLGIDSEEEINLALEAVGEIEIAKPNWSETHAQELVDQNHYTLVNEKIVKFQKAIRYDNYHEYRSRAYLAIARAQKKANLDYSKYLELAKSETRSISKWNDKGKELYDSSIKDIEEFELEN